MERNTSGTLKSFTLRKQNAIVLLLLIIEANNIINIKNPYEFPGD